MRLTEESAIIREVYPESYLDFAILVTDVGGVTFLMVLLSVLYWLTDRRQVALVVSYVVAGFVFITAIKVVLGMPRPPAEVMVLGELDGDPYGFPSGHAFISVVVYGGLLWAFDLVRKWWALLGVALLVVAISLSRVVVGVHYLGDVLVGAPLGLLFLFAVIRLVDGSPTRGFVLASALAIPGVIVADGVYESVMGLGLALGGLAVAGSIENLPDLRSRLEGAVVTVVGLAVIVAGTLVESAVVGFEPAAALVYAAIVASIVLLPGAVGRIEGGVLGPSAG